jgi:hypothetical protein
VEKLWPRKPKVSSLPKTGGRLKSPGPGGVKPSLVEMACGMPITESPVSSWSPDVWDATGSL